jgi:hypothetical protein
MNKQDHHAAAERSDNAQRRTPANSGVADGLEHDKSPQYNPQSIDA